MRYYHFTSTLHLPAILQTGHLTTTDSILDPTDPHASPPCVWLLDTETLTGYPHGLEGSIANKKAVRFTVNLPEKQTLNWVNWAQAQHMNPEWFSTMVQIGGGLEAARHWIVTFRPIPHTHWEAIHQLSPTGEYEPLPHTQWAPTPAT